MEHRNRDARGRRSLVLAQIAVCIFFFLSFATLPIVPSTEARVPTLDTTPFQILATPVLETPAPTALPGQTTLDKYTVALYRFDSTGSAALDDTWRYPGTLNGNASIVSSGVYRGALSLDGQGSSMTSPNLPSLSQGTLEAFVDFQSVCYTAVEFFPIITARSADGGGEILQLRVSGGVMFGIYSEGRWNWVDSGINACRYLSYGPSAPGWPYETWRFHQVAGTWGPRGLEIWVDGVLHGVGNDDPNENIAPYKYKCNPQMQLGVLPWPPNPLYPVCQTPVIAPQMPAYPRGDYMGGIPSASLVIGCGSDGCFKGRIDEVRVSNIQRSFSWTVVPTITPTPTITPVFIGGEYAPDSNTTALYHLSQEIWQDPMRLTWDDASRSWDAELAGNALLASGGRFGNAMTLNSYPAYLNMSPITGSPGSIGSFEAWVNLAPDTSEISPLFVGGDRSDQIYFGLYPPAPGHIAFAVNNGDKVIVNETQIMKSEIAGSWHHLAATWGYRGLEVWLDGMLCNTVEFTGTFPKAKEFTASGCDRIGHCTKGMVDEVRVSRVQRSYSAAAGQYQRSRSSVGNSFWPYTTFFPLMSFAPSPTPRAGCRPF